VNYKQIILSDIAVKDANDYINLHKIINTENPYMIRPSGQYEVPAKQIEQEAIEHGEKAFKYWKVLRIEGQLAGHIRLSRSSKQRLKHKAELTIGLQEKYTGSGLGKMMLEDCISWCNSNGIERLDLHVVSENFRGIALYKKYGFKEVGLLKNDIKVSENIYYDSVYMTKHL